ncbi:hypothetical protein [Streptomyces sp. SAS_270]|uniref:hypothetical protein n=1 Tax=Streptomyces sp. SAS_270 TaxID=3412748 RepID=UPI00403D536A
MTSHIDDLLARARLRHEPYTQADIDAAAARLATRAAASRPGPLEDDASERDVSPGEEACAADDLQTLCETVITHTDALADLELFLARGALPEPPGARVLGCMLQLSEREESARFWWQYAAGAGDPAASYCLYLHHRALGEHGAADWWHTQTDAVADRDTDEPDTEITTTLRILRALKPDGSPVPDPVNAVLHYVPAAVAYVDDDLDLPLPDPDFTERVRALAAPPPQDTVCRGGRRSGPLPEHRRAPLPKLPKRRRTRDPSAGST